MKMLSFGNFRCFWKPNKKYLLYYTKKQDSLAKKIKINKIKKYLAMFSSMFLLTNYLGISNETTHIRFLLPNILTFFPFAQIGKLCTAVPFFLLQLGSLRGNVDPIWQRDRQQPSRHGRQNDHAFFGSFRRQRWCTCILVCFRVGSWITWFISSYEENNCTTERIHKLTLEIVLDEESCHFEWK